MSKPNNPALAEFRYSSKPFKRSQRTVEENARACETRRRIDDYKERKALRELEGIG